MRYTLVLADRLSQRVERHLAAPLVTDPAELRELVRLARNAGCYAYITTIADARDRPIARTLERRLAASPPADPGLPLALPPLRGPRARRDLGARLVVRLPAELLARLDAARGELDRSAWVRAAIDSALGEQEGE